MSNTMFRKATKSQAHLRLAIYGASGSGKTFTALRIAKGLGGSIAVIDTEHGSASKYSDRFDFDVADVSTPTIENVIKVMDAAAGHYDILIIDSLTHPWSELLSEVDQIAKRYKDNSWAAWRDGTPKQKKLVQALLKFPGHLIATMRSKTEWVITSDNGKNKPQRVGLSPEQGKGIEYEFDMLIEISPEHYAQVIKDRTGKYQDEGMDKPGEEFGKALSEWLSSGAAPKAELDDDGHDKAADKFRDDFAERYKWFKAFHAEEHVMNILGAAGYEKASEIPADKRAAFLRSLDDAKALLQQEIAAKEGADKAMDAKDEPAAEIDAPITEAQQMEFEEAGI